MFLKKSLWAAGIVAAAPAISTDVYAATFTLDFSGTVGRVSDTFSALPDEIQSGADFSGTVTYETNEVDSSSTSDFFGTFHNFPDTTSSNITLSFGNLDINARFDTATIKNSNSDTGDSVNFNAVPEMYSNGYTAVVPSLQVLLQDQSTTNSGDLITSENLPNTIDAIDLGAVSESVGNLQGFYRDTNGNLGGFDVSLDIDPGSLSFGEMGEPEPTPPAASVASFNETSLFGDKSSFDPDKPSVVVTHGWQRGGSYTGQLGSVDFLDKMYLDIKAQYGSEVNVLLFSWSKAFTGTLPDPSNISEPLPYVNQAGIELGKQLTALFGTEYSHPIHMIGHSYGSAVNLDAASELQLNGIETAHMTILDAPTNSPAGLGLPNSYFSLASNSTWIGYLENYYGTEGGLAGAYGDAIPGTVLNGGYTYDTDHSGVWEQYAGTIGQTGCGANGGFSHSAALGNAGCYSEQLDQSIENIQLNSTAAQLDLLLQQHAQFDTAKSTLSVSTGSDGYAVFNLAVPLFADSLSFDLGFTKPGDGDWLEVSFNDSLLGAYRGIDWGDTSRSLMFDFSLFAGQSGILSILLASSGPGQAQANISNFQFISTESVAPSPVPLPATAWLLGFSMLVIFAMGRRVRLSREHSA